MRPENFKERITRSGTLPPLFDVGRTERLRARLLNAGVDPLSVGLPPPPKKSFHIPAPPPITYRDACREIKYDFVKKQMAQMPKIISEWRQVREEERLKERASKLPF